MKKLDEVTKVRLIYSGELALFAVVFAVIGVLQLIGVWEVKEWVLQVFKFVAPVAAAYFIYDFVTSFTNKRKREKVCFVDKFSTIFVPPYSLTLAIMLFVNYQFVFDNRNLFFPPLLLAISVVYLFQAIYHWFNPLKELFEDDESPNGKEVVATIENPVEVVSEEEIQEKNS